MCALPIPFTGAGCSVPQFPHLLRDAPNPVVHHDSPYPGVPSWESAPNLAPNPVPKSQEQSAALGGWGGVKGVQGDAKGGHGDVKWVQGDAKGGHGDVKGDQGDAKGSLGDVKGVQGAKGFWAD